MRTEPRWRKRYCRRATGATPCPFPRVRGMTSRFSSMDPGTVIRRLTKSGNISETGIQLRTDSTLHRWTETSAGWISICSTAIMTAMGSPTGRSTKRVPIRMTRIPPPDSISGWLPGTPLTGIFRIIRVIIVS